MQRPGTDIKRVLRHHVFELQCIVDSLTVSRGWSLSSLRGHILCPPGHGFRPRRDVDLFLDRENERVGSEFLGAVDVLKQFFERDSVLNENPRRHEDSYDLLESLQYDFVNWLGESKYMYDLNTIPPSRFSNTNANGLWEYSPYLCGVGLTEGLQLSYGACMAIWDRIPEPMLLVHLHNMLVKKGYITELIGLYASLQSLMPTAFFVDGKAPSSSFHAALTARTEVSRPARRGRESVIRSATDIHSLLNLDANQFFRTKTTLVQYKQANWDPDRIPQEEIDVSSTLSLLRLSKAR
ncbi:hypothetical protein NKR23_g214 [Pleurostoma richardsiae]|uniref:Uncharacterized protein n=1 Tax=Pleurostoma richardsiae TaxID=41990 RepID=A0AA38RUH6_9PEZI|nr:hypothetical protein NKR23_g214 [Pleurostoma richardsiae]